jgi:hypothetical protein
MAGNRSQYGDLVKSVLEGVDANIGNVHLGRPVWKGGTAFQEGARIEIAQASTLDTVARVGTKTTRFWLITSRTESEVLTNHTDELRHEFTLRAFYGIEEEHDHEEILRAAVDLVLDRFRDKTVELTTLSPGSGHQGYLSEPPREELEVETAIIRDLGMEGYTAVVGVTVFEEVAR